jgi:hypothetical protein
MNGSGEMADGVESDVSLPAAGFWRQLDPKLYGLFLHVTFKK